MNKDNKSVGGFWKKTTSKGLTLLSGSINGQKYVIFQNTFKKKDDPNDNSPDYKVYPALERNNAQAPQQQQSKARTKYVPQSRSSQPARQVQQVEEAPQDDQDVF